MFLLYPCYIFLGFPTSGSSIQNKCGAGAHDLERSVPIGSFYRFEVLFVAVLIKRAKLFEVYTGALRRFPKPMYKVLITTETAKGHNFQELSCSSSITALRSCTGLCRGFNHPIFLVGLRRIPQTKLNMILVTI